MSEDIEVKIKGTQDVDKAAGKASEGLKELGKSSSTAKENLADYAKGQLSASSGLSSFVSQITPANIALVALAATVAKVVSAMYELSVKSFTVADQWASVVNDIEDKTNMTGESASKLASVAQMVGLSGADMGQALAIMSHNAQSAAEQINAAAAEGAISEDIFTKWGIAITDSNGDLLSAERIYNNVNKRHREMANGVQKTAMEMEIFGRSGAKMNDLLNLSENQVDATTQTLRDMGMVINSETSQAFEDLDQKGNLVNLCFDGLYNQMGQAFLPVVDETRDMLIDLARELNNSGVAMDFANTMAEAAETGLYAMKGAADVCKAAYENLVKPIWDVIDALDKFINKVTGFDALRKLFSGGIGLLSDIGKYNKGVEDDEKQKASLANGWMSSGNSDDWDLAKPTAVKNTTLLNNAAGINSEAAKKMQEAARINDEAARKAEEIAKQQDSIINIADSLSKAGYEFGVNGCTAFVNAALSNTKWAQLFEGERLDVGKARAYADAAGLYHQGVAGMSRGDVIVYGNNENPDGSHVGIYDGSGGVYHNSTSAGRAQGTGPIAYHSSDYTAMGPDTSVLGYISTGGSEANADQLKAYKTMLTRAQKAQEELAKAKDAADKTFKDVSLKVLEMSGSAYDLATEKAKRIARDYKDIVDKAAGQGLNTKDLSDQLVDYNNLVNNKISREHKTEDHNNIMSNLAQNLAARTSYASKVRDLQMDELKQYQNTLERELATMDLSEKDKLELRKQYGEAQADYETLASQKTSTAWNVAADQLLNRTVNFAEMVTQTTDNINNSIMSGMQNWVGSEESLGDRLVKIWQNVANSVINMIVQIALQQSILTPLSNTIGNMFKSFGGSNPSLSYLGIGTLLGGNSIGASSNGVWGFADGGYSPAGLRIIGEHGPELEDTRTPGRVYTNDQLRDALSGNSRGPQVVMNINTPDAGSFKQSRSQIAASVSAMVQRGQR